MVEMIESKSLGVQPNTAEKKRFPEKSFISLSPKGVKVVVKECIIILFSESKKHQEYLAKTIFWHIWLRYF